MLDKIIYKHCLSCGFTFTVVFPVLGRIYREPKTCNTSFEFQASLAWYLYNMRESKIGRKGPVTHTVKVTC